jgi:hypothetical protein
LKLSAICPKCVLKWNKLPGTDDEKFVKLNTKSKKFPQPKILNDWEISPGQKSWIQFPELGETNENEEEDTDEYYPNKPLPRPGTLLRFTPGHHAGPLKSFTRNKRALILSRCFNGCKTKLVRVSLKKMECPDCHRRYNMNAYRLSHKMSMQQIEKVYKTPEVAIEAELQCQEQVLKRMLRPIMEPGGDI